MSRVIICKLGRLGELRKLLDCSTPNQISLKKIVNLQDGGASGTTESKKGIFGEGASSTEAATASSSSEEEMVPEEKKGSLLLRLLKEENLEALAGPGADATGMEEPARRPVKVRKKSPQEPEPPSSTAAASPMEEGEQPLSVSSPASAEITSPGPRPPSSLLATEEVPSESPPKFRKEREEDLQILNGEEGLLLDERLKRIIVDLKVGDKVSEIPDIEIGGGHTLK